MKRREEVVNMEKLNERGRACGSSQKMKGDKTKNETYEAIREDLAELIAHKDLVNELLDKLITKTLESEAGDDVVKAWMAAEKRFKPLRFLRSVGIKDPASQKETMKKLKVPKASSVILEGWFSSYIRFLRKDLIRVFRHLDGFRNKLIGIYQGEVFEGVYADIKLLELRIEGEDSSFETIDCASNLTDLSFSILQAVRDAVTENGLSAPEADSIVEILDDMKHTITAFQQELGAGEGE